MNTRAPTKQSKTMVLKPGFHAIRYLCRGEGPLPVAALGVPPTDRAGNIEVLGRRKGGQVVLEAFGDMAVVFVDGEEMPLTLTMFVPEGFPKQRVEISVESLDKKERMASSAPVSLVRLSGHVERVGDVDCGFGEWLGDPKSSTRVEGFSLFWPERPLGVDISYGCVVAGVGKSPSVLTGNLVGTRRRAAPIEAVWVELIGERAGEYSLEVEAAFKDSGTARGGSGKLLRGVLARDYLVALKITLKSVDIAAKVHDQWRDKVREVNTFYSANPF